MLARPAARRRWSRRCSVRRMLSRARADCTSRATTQMRRQQGLHFLAQGAFAGIANIAAHDHAAWTEREALEHLAVLSVVALRCCRYLMRRLQIANAYDGLTQRVRRARLRSPPKRRCGPASLSPPC
jgi:hypothetical protein